MDGSSWLFRIIVAEYKCQAFLELRWDHQVLSINQALSWHHSFTKDATSATTTHHSVISHSDFSTYFKFIIRLWPGWELTRDKQHSVINYSCLSCNSFNIWSIYGMHASDGSSNNLHVITCSVLKRTTTKLFPLIFAQLCWWAWNWALNFLFCPALLDQ